MTPAGTNASAALRWVRQDLDDTLLAVRDNLEIFAADPANREPLRVVQEKLEQLNLTFVTMEQKGACILTDEMIAVGGHMLHNGRGNVQESLAALTDAVVVLPSYLDRLQAGHKDLPILLLPTLNELRATHDESLLSEGTLFAPQLDLMIPELSGNEADALGTSEFPSFARRARNQFQAALLSWLKEQSRVENLLPLQRVCRVLHERLGRHALRRLWWIADMAIAGLHDGAIDNDLPLRRMFARLDLTLKAMTEGGEDGPSDDALVALSRALLFHAAQARPGSAGTDLLRRRFRLEELIPDREALLRARGAVTGRDAELFRSIGEAVREELSLVKDALDMELRTGRVEADQREASRTSLRQLADTLNMLNLPVPARAVEELLPLLEQAEGQLNNELDSPLLRLAQKLIGVESVLETHIRLLGEPVETRASAGYIALPAFDFDLIIARVLDECIASLQDVQEAVRKRLGGDSEADFHAPLKDIVGALELAGQSEVTILATKLGRCLDAELSTAAAEGGGGEPRQRPHLDSLTDAVAALELYLAGSRDQQADSQRFLQIMHERLDGMPEAAAAAPAPIAPIRMEAAATAAPTITTTESGTLPAAAPDPEPAVAAEAARGVALDPSMQEIFLEDLISPATADRAAVPGDVESEIPATAPAAVASDQRDPTDPELARLMIAEIVQYAATLDEFIDEVAAGTGRVDPQLLRSMHTLAGTLAMSPLGQEVEVAHQLELYLRRLQRTEAPVGADAAAVLALCVHRFRQRISVLEDGVILTYPATDQRLLGEIEALHESATAHHQHMRAAAAAQAAAEAVAEAEAEAVAAAVVEAEAEAVAAVEAEAEAVAAAEAVAEAEAVAAVEAEAVAAISTGAAELKPSAARALDDPRRVTAEPPADTHDATGIEEIDVGVLAIFLEEAVEVLERCDTLLNTWRDQLADYKLVQNLQREIHTFKGGARMAALDALGDLSHAMETLLEQIAAKRLQPTIAAVQALEDGTDRLTTWIEELLVGRMPLAGDALARFEQRARALSGVFAAAQPAIILPEAPPPAPVAASGEVAQYTVTEDDSAAAPHPAPWQPVPRDTGVTHAFDQAASASGPFATEPTEDAATHALEPGEHDAADQPVARPADAAPAQSGAPNESEAPNQSEAPNRVGAPAAQVTPTDVVIAGPEADADAVPAETRTAAGDISDFTDFTEVAAASAPIQPAAPALAPALAPASAPQHVRRELREVPDRPAAEAGEEGSGQQHIRVAAELIDSLVNYAGEISIYRARLEQQLGSVRNNLKEVEQTVGRLQEQLRKMDIEAEAQMLTRYQHASVKGNSEFDPLELDRFSNMQQLSRALNESVNDLLNLQEMITESVRQGESLLVQQSRVSSDLQEGLMQTRMTPFGSAAPRLRRVVRAAATETGKRARLSLKMAGTSDQLDRNVLERITAPLEHMLRNSVVHGIESPKERRRLNKPEEGEITVTVEGEATEFVVRVEDDGSGVNLPAVRRRAIERGMIGQHEDVDDQRLTEFILESGFSTADTVTGLAGRGVGMDVVRSEIKQIGGSMEIASEAGRGTSFTIRIPFSLAVMQAIGVTVGTRPYLVPLNSVSGVSRMLPADYLALRDSESPVYQFAGEDFPLLELEPLLGEQPIPVQSENVSLLMIRSGEHKAAFRLAALQGHQEIVMKPVGPQVSSIPGILGATISGDGQVVIILDMGPVIRRGLAVAANPRRSPVPQQEKQQRKPLVMVVDDSITMRKVTSRVLENHSLEVMTAQDGLDAIESLHERVPDLMLLDIEMPRMDGYELAEHVRGDPRLRHVPIVMITSRAGQKHRRRAREAGADDYMTKPYQEAELISKVSEMLKLDLRSRRDS